MKNNFGKPPINLKETLKLMVIVKLILRKFSHPPDMKKTGHRNRTETGGIVGGGVDCIKNFYEGIRTSFFQKKPDKQLFIKLFQYP